MASLIGGRGAFQPACRHDGDASPAPTELLVADGPATVPAPRTHAPPCPRPPGRHPQTLQLLCRLRTELAQTAPAPASVDDAHRAIADAMTRARLGGWSLPALDATTNDRHADGSVTIPLIAHVVVIDPTGAFRIVDALRPATPWFEMAGAGGHAFRGPARPKRASHRGP